MAQVSYGTITITDTNDIEKIYMEYAQSQNNQTAPTTGWDDDIPTWREGYYIWQRTVTKMSGVPLSQDSYGEPVCLTGSTGSSGAPGQSVDSIVTSYCNYGTGTPAATYSGWQSAVPAYDSTKPNYWIKTVITYSNPTTTDTKIYKDNGITSATSTAAAANTTAQNAKDKADDAWDKADNAETIAGNANTAISDLNQYFWRKKSASTNVPAGSYVTNIPGTTYQQDPANGGFNSLVQANGIFLRNGIATLSSWTGDALTFYHPTNSGQGNRGMELSSSTLKFYDSTGTVAQATFGGTQATVSGTINVYDGKIGNASNYWYIGNYTDYNQNDSAIIKSIGTASIQLNETNTWRIATNRIHTAWAPATGTDAYKLHFPIYVDSENTNRHWDYGLHLPTSYSDKFLYIRNAASSETLDNLLDDLDDAGYNYWNYIFYIDGSGNLHAGDIYSHGTLISGTSAPYLLKSGGTMTGNITMSNGAKLIGDVTGNVSGSAGKLSNTSKIGDTNKPVYFSANGVPVAISYEINKSVPSNAIFTDQNVRSTQANTTKLWLVGTPTSGDRTGTLNYDSGVYITTTAGVLHATTFEGNLSGTASRATADSDGNTIKTTYLKLSGGNVTGAVTFGSSVSVDELTAGDLVVNGNASFTNNAQFNTINGVAVGSNPKFTDTTYSSLSAASGGTAVSLVTTGEKYTWNNKQDKLTNPVTGTGTSGYLTKWTGTNTIGNGPALGTGTTKFLREDGTWVVPSGTTYTAGNGLRLSGTQFINTRIPFVVGTQTAATGSWTGVCNDITALYDGLTIAYWLPYAGNGNATLNLTINGTATGAKNCYYSGTSRLTTHFGAGNIIYLTYRSAGNINGTNYEGWWANANYDSNDTGYYHRRIYPNIKAGPNKIYPYTLIMQLPDGRWESLVTSNSTGTSKARNTSGFVLGHVLLMYYNETYTENQNLSTYRIWSAHTGLIDHRYSFNTANDSTNGTTGYKPIYLVGTLGADGLFYLADKWWTQTLPNTADGKIYIYIGDAYDYYRMTFTEDKPMYVYTNGKLREFSQDAATVTGHTVAKDVPSNAIFTDTWNALSTSQAGYVAKAPNDTGKFLRGDATWAAVTKSNVGLGNVENKSSATIRGEITSSNVTTALGFTPYNSTNPSGYITANDAGVVNVGPDDGHGKLRVYFNTIQTETNNYYKDVDVQIVATEASSATQADKLATEGTIITNLSTTGTGAAKKYTEGGNIEPGVKGTLGVGFGGTGKTSWTQWGIVYASATGTLAQVTAGASGNNGYLLQSNGAAAPGWIQATNSNTASTIVKRDSSGNFSAGTITATLSGSATSAGKATNDSDGNPINTTYLKKSGGIMSGGLEIKGHIAGDGDSSGHGLWGGGGYHNAYNNIILHGDATTGSSGIAFVSDKGDTTINQPSDRAFIQFHAYGITTTTAEGTNPTLATTGEANRLVIGVGNDATDEVWIQTPAAYGLKHQVGTTTYTIPCVSSYTTTANYPVISTTTGGVHAYNTSITMNGGIITATTFSGSLSGNASSATEFSSNATVTLTGDTTGTSAGSKKSWTVSTTTNKLNLVRRFNNSTYINVNVSNTYGYNKLFYSLYDSTSRSTDATNSPSFDAGVLNMTWDWGAYNGQIALTNTDTTPRMQIRAASHTDNGESANPRYTPNYGAWREVVTATKATQVGSGTKLTYVSDNGQVTESSSNIGSARQAAYLSSGTITAGNYTVAHFGNAGKSNMNDIGRLHASVGMTNLTDPGNTIDNPMNGTTKSTNWHLYWNANYTDDPNGSNAWVAQIVNKAGTNQWWVRSRSGGTITNGTDWTANWKHLVVSPQAGQGDSTVPVYIDANGQVQSITSYSGNAATATNVAWSGITSNPITFNTTAYGTTGWSQLGGRTNPLNSIRVWKPTDTVAWGTIAHSAVIAFGYGDTKGMIDCSYNSPVVSIAGGNVSGSTDAAPKWYFKFSATSGATYTLPTTSKTLVATDGTGASGTWAISISGTAAKATADKNGNDITTKYVTIDTNQTITASQKTFNGATRWSVTNSTTGSKYGACNYDATLDALVFSFGTI